MHFNIIPFSTQNVLQTTKKFILSVYTIFAYGHLELI